MDITAIHDKANTIIVKLRDQRKLKGLTQGQISAELDLTQKGYSKIELGHTKMTLETLLAVAEILDLRLTELFD